MSTFTPQEKSRIFVERTQNLWPQNWEMYLDLVSHELWSKDELHAFNFQKRVEILKYAYENTEFYKKLYDNIGLKPEDIRSEKDWEQVPIVTKQMIADFSGEFEVKRDIKKFGFVANTGGSTGKPLKVYRDRRHFWQAPFWRLYGWHLGRECGKADLSIPIWGLDQAYVSRDLYRFTSEELRAKEIAFWPIEYFYLDCYADFSKTIPTFMEKASKSPLMCVYAYAGGMDMLADYCIQNNIKWPKNIAFIECCASPLTNLLREKVHKVFNCPVFDFYGSNEMGPMALECSRSGAEHHLHVQSDIINIELVDAANHVIDGEEVGTTIVTDLTNKVFPFVRYNHGDKTHWINKPCDCGLPFPTIAPIRGRSTEYIATKNGFHIDGVGFNEIFDFNPNAARAFQFRQSVDGYATLLVVPNNKYEHSLDEIQTIYNKLQADFKGDIEFSLKYVESINSDGGKQRYIVHE